MLSLYYIQALFRDLRDLGYHQLALPVVAMQQLIADLILDNNQLKKLVHLRYMVFDLVYLPLRHLVFSNCTKGEIFFSSPLPPPYPSFSLIPSPQDAFSSLPKPLPSLNPRRRSLDQIALARQNTSALQATTITLREYS